MMSCEQALEWISASLDLPLTQDEQQALEQHLANCPECRALLADFQKIHQELSHMTAQPPAALCEGVMDRIKAQETEKIVPIRRRPARPWLRWGAAAAVFAVVLLGAGSAGVLDTVFSGGNANTTAESSAADTPQSRMIDDAQTDTQADTQTDTQAESQAEAPDSSAAGDAQTAEALDGSDLQTAASAVPSPSAAQQSASTAVTGEATAAAPTAAQESGIQTAQTAGETTAQSTVQSAAASDSSQTGAESTDGAAATYNEAPQQDTPMVFESTAEGAYDSSAAGAGLTQEDAQQYLRAWLLAAESEKNALTTADSSQTNPAEDISLVSLGLSADGTCWLFAWQADSGVTHYAVPVDGSEIFQLDQTD